ncbi:histidinol-phosphate transaminase [Salinimicrobium sp. MT39]|uniref:Histidinol-phosphate aminotransferase n=1 Tax=Salinimicrobium profundisediminis TaxID=2994553 RepID=A0A9X3I008_9FLAO|nr:histidinol-phosphate transaminase [Salinimicrobium profundisediminis]MCX2837336.1 histidinol-phosphate transaminase [Salinimicrobium profundisediminis]
MSNSFDLNSLVRANVLKMKPYSSARDEYKTDGRKMTFLDANENPFENGVNRYPDPQQGKLKQLLASQKGVSGNKILLGNGSDEVLDLIFRTFCQPQVDNVITLPPTYGMYKVLAGLNEVEDREVVLKTDFQPNVETILERVDGQTKLIFLCSPNNPTGNSFSEASVEKILKNFNGLVVIDEAYIDFSAEKSWLQRLEEFPNLVITQTLSKAYGLAGIRLGICYASEEIIGILNKIKPPYNVNELTQKRAHDRLSRPEEVSREVEAILQERESLRTNLSKMAFVKDIFPSDANFLLARVDDAAGKYEQLLKAGVVVRNRSNQELCENTLRFTVGTPEENRELIKKLTQLEA